MITACVCQFLEPKLGQMLSTEFQAMMMFLKKCNTEHRGQQYEQI